MSWNMATIAFGGLGMMGSQMATKLRSAGHQVRAWNRTASKARTWASAGGGEACDTPADAARGADSVHLMLSDDDAVQAALFGDHGALSTLAAGKLVVDHSTVSVAGAASRAASMKARGFKVLQAPMLAGPSGIAEGAGLMLVAGARPVYEQATAVLSQIMPRQWFLGEREQDAATYKLMANSILLNAAEAMVEFFAIGEACGIDRQRAMTLFQHFDPSKTYTLRGARMARREYEAAFTAAMAGKDARLMIEAARSGGADIPGISIVADHLQAMVDAGRGDLDLAALAG